jgi:hypothetical protein
MVLLKKLKETFERFTGDDDRDDESVDDLFSSPENPQPWEQISPFQPIDEVEKPIEDANIQEETSEVFNSIYSLEKVDASTVRPLSAKKETVDISLSSMKGAPVPLEKPSKVLEEDTFRDNFNFGQEYAERLPSFKLNEPIEVLKLHPQALACLHENEKKTIKDVIETKEEEYVFFKGMGQGHIDQLNQSLHNYIQGESLYNSPTVNLKSFLRSLLNDIEFDQRFLVLENFGLEDIFHWTKEEKALVKHLSKQQKEETYSKAWKQVTQDSKKLRAKKWMKEISESYLAPWVRRRQGMVKEFEVLERAYSIVVEPVSFSKYYEFLKKAYFNGKNPFLVSLPTLDQKVFFSDEYTKNEAEKITKKTLTYFYKPFLEYSLDELESFVEREFAKEWLGFFPGFVRQVIRNSGLFRVRKRANHQLTVKLTSNLC